MFYNSGLCVKRIPWPIHLCARLFLTLSTCSSRAPASVQKYRSVWLKWRDWAASKISIQVIPVKPLHIALFISELTKISVRNNTGISPIESVVYSIQWGHNLAGLEECPTSHPTPCCHPWRVQEGILLVLFSPKSLHLLTRS